MRAERFFYGFIWTIVIAIFLVSLAGCSSTGVSQANDVSFNAAAVRLCDPVSLPAALRNLNEEEQAARELFCEARLKRILEN